MTADHELRPSGDQRTEHVVATAQRPLSRDPPRWRGEMVVQRHDPNRIRWALLKPLHAALEVVAVEGSALLTPGTDGVEADDDRMLRHVDWLRRTENVLPLVEGSREPRRERVRDVVVPGHHDEGEPQATQERRGVLELRPAASMGEVARREQQLGFEICDQGTQRVERLPRLRMPHVEIGEVENPGVHRRGRLYTRYVAEESPELFDDIYLGLRAGGAARKQRRGEPLSNEEAEAISRWRRLSLWRKTIAVGAFALGTFGLGFTVGGLVFGRWRKA